VRSYAWSPDGDRIAFVMGEFRGIYANYANTSTWIWDAAGRRRTNISDDGYDVTWAKFDGNVYLWNRVGGIAGKAVRYNIATGALEATSHVSIYFSPSGEYYYHPGGGVGLQEDVYSRATDVGLKAGSRVLSSVLGWRPAGWAPDADLLLMEVRRNDSRGDEEMATIVFDPKQDTAVDIPDAEVVGWGYRDDDLVLRTGGRLSVKGVADLKAAAAR
jgi:Tol biopolymer transport system component